MRAPSGAFVMTISEEDCATQVYEQPNAGNPDRFVKMNFQRNKQPVHRLARHQEGHEREHDRAGEPAEHTNFSSAETEARVACLRSCEVVRHSRYQECNHM